MTVHKKLIGNFQVTCQRLSIFAKSSMFPFEDICVQTFIFSFIAVQIHVVRVLIEEFRIMCLRMTSYKKALLTILNRPCAILYVNQVQNHLNFVCLQEQKFVIISFRYQQISCTCTSAQGYVMAIYQKQFCMNKYQRMSLDPRTL